MANFFSRRNSDHASAQGECTTLMKEQLPTEVLIDPLRGSSHERSIAAMSKEDSKKSIIMSKKHVGKSVVRSGAGDAVDRRMTFADGQSAGGVSSHGVPGEKAELPNEDTAELPEPSPGRSAPRSQGRKMQTSE